MKMVKDPVCGMEVEAEGNGPTSKYKGKIYHFCNPSCKWAFDSDPEQFVKKSKKEK